MIIILLSVLIAISIFLGRKHFFNEIKKREVLSSLRKQFKANYKCIYTFPCGTNAYIVDNSRFASNSVVMDAMIKGSCLMLNMTQDDLKALSAKFIEEVYKEDLNDPVVKRELIRTAEFLESNCKRLVNLDALLDVICAYVIIDDEDPVVFNPEDDKRKRKLISQSKASYDFFLRWGLSTYLKIQNSPDSYLEMAKYETRKSLPFLQYLRSF